MTTEAEIANESASEIAPTPIARALAEDAPGMRLTEYCGVRTVSALADEAAEMAAALYGVAVHDLGWQRRVAVTGEDRMRWLNGMVTNHVAALNAGEPESGAGNYNLVLNAQGRIQGDCRVWRTNHGTVHEPKSDGLELEITAHQTAAMKTHLERFIIMDDVELTPIPGWTALGVTGSKATAVLEALGMQAIAAGAERVGRLRATGGQEIVVLARRDMGRQAGHLALWCREEDARTVWQALVATGATAIGAETVERLRIVEGIPAFGVDFASDTLPQEAGVAEALHFTKGCYLGQEIVERIHSRGQVHRHVRAMEIFPDGQEPVVGLELTAADGKPAGKLTSVAHVEMDGVTRWFALGVVRTEAETGMAELKYAGGRAQVLTRVPTLTTTTN